MSGHSKWATIHRQKGIKDQARGKLFSKLARAISIAVKTGGGPSPDTNLTLRVAIDKARQSNMPKENIERAISKASDTSAVEQIVYEGFGPVGISVIVDAGTDNRNRTGQEIKNLFDRAGGKMAGPGAVSYNFEPKGLIVVSKKGNSEEDMLALIDLGVDDVEEISDGFEVYVSPTELFDKRSEIEKSGFSVTSSELIQKPKQYQTVHDAKDAQKVVNFLSNLEDHDDVQKVFTNVDIPQDIASQLS